VSADQIIVTHCLKQQSVLSEAGYSIRATSLPGIASDQAMKRFALDFPSLRLPVDMRGSALDPARAPRSLALVPAPGGRVALVHSAYLPFDSSGQRPHSFLTHILLYGRLSFREALTAWGSSDWKTSYGDGEPQSLSPFAGVPQGVDLAPAVTRFLSGLPSSDQDLATTTYPERLAADPEGRRRLMRAALLGFIAMRQPGPAGRDRLFLQGEPGLVALLLYGIARLLPSSVLEGLTFATYLESPKAFREYQPAQVRGTYASNLRHGLESDYLGRLGFGVDTFTGGVSPDLQADRPHHVDAMLDLAAAGEWSQIDGLLTHWGRTAQPLNDFLRELTTIASRLGRLGAAKATIDDVLAIAGTELGRAVLQTSSHRGKAWPVVLEHRARPDVARQFAALFRLDENRSDLLGKLFEALTTGSPQEWRREWEVLKSHFPGNEGTALLDEFLRGAASQAAASPPALRVELLKEWSAVGGGVLPPAQVTLLVDLEPKMLVKASLPSDWVGRAAFAAAAGGAAPSAQDVLRTRDAGVCKGFVQAAATAGSPDAERALARLLPQNDPLTPDLFGHLLRAGLELGPARLDALLVAVGADHETWNTFWDHESNLSVLGKLPANGEFLRRHWRRIDKTVSIDCLTDTNRRKTLDAARRARVRLGPVVPDDTARILDDWDMLEAYIRAPDIARADAVVAACKRRGMKRRDVLSLALTNLTARGGSVATGPLSALIETTRRFYGEDRTAFGCWIDVVESHPESQRTPLLRAFLNDVPLTQQSALIQTYEQRVTKPIRAMVSSPPPASTSPPAAPATPAAKVAATPAPTFPMPRAQRVQSVSSKPPPRGHALQISWGAAGVFGLVAFLFFMFWLEGTASVVAERKAREKSDADLKNASKALEEAKEAQAALKKEKRKIEDGREELSKQLESKNTRIRELEDALADTKKKLDEARIQANAAPRAAPALGVGPGSSGGQANLANPRPFQPEDIPIGECQNVTVAPARDPGPLIALTRPRDDPLAYLALPPGGEPKTIRWQPPLRDRLEITYSPGGSRLAAWGPSELWLLTLQKGRGYVPSRVPGLGGPTTILRRVAISGQPIVAVAVRQAGGNRPPTLSSPIPDPACPLLEYDFTAADGSADVSALAFSVHSTDLVVGYQDGQVHAFPLAGQDRFRLFPQVCPGAGELRDLVFSHDGEWLAGCRGNAIELWAYRQADHARPPGRLAHDAASVVTCVAFDPADRLLASGDDRGNVRLWDAARRQPLSTLTAPGRVLALAISPDGHWLLAVSRTEDRQGFIRRWNLGARP
jgi:hypothetical protein